jgi:hypothetical protein
MFPPNPTSSRTFPPKSSAAASAFVSDGSSEGEQPASDRAVQTDRRKVRQPTGRRRAIATADQKFFWLLIKKLNPSKN